MRGSVAILLVIITITLITAVVVEINYRSQVSATVVANRRDGEKAYQLARAAVRWSIFRLQLDNALDQIPAIPGTNYGGMKDDLSEVQWAVPIPYPFAAESLAGKITGGAEGEESPVEKPKKEETSAEDIGGSFLSAIEDESSKINVNDVASARYGTTVQWSGAAEILENLLLSPRFQSFFKNSDHREILWAIDDWTDSDSEVNHLGGGVEDAEYKTDDPELHVKNAPFYSVEELHQLKPVTADIFRELQPFITVYPFDARTPHMNTFFNAPLGKINVNTTPLEILAALFSRQVMPDPKERLQCAQKLVKYRKNVVFRQYTDFMAAVSQLCGLQERQGEPPIFSQFVKPLIQMRSNFFSVEATGSVNQTEKTIHAIISRENVTAPRILYWKVI